MLTAALLTSGVAAETVGTVQYEDIIPSSMATEAEEADPELLGAVKWLAARERRQAASEARQARASASAARAAAKAQQPGRPRARVARCSKGAPGIIIQKPIQNKILPAERPPHWNYCTEECKINSTIIERTEGNEGIFIQVFHKPIANVTPEMMLWWFSGNIEGDIVHPLDGKTYSRYLVWHPFDHIHEITVSKSRAIGSVVGHVREITEFLGTRHTTPSRTVGYLINETNCEWKDEYYANDQLEVAALDITGLTLQLKIGFRVKPMRMRHDWSASDEGLMLVSTLRIGFPGDTNFIRWANNRYARRAFGGDRPMVAADLFVKHCLEEFSNLKHFLPGLYKDQTGRG